MGIDLLDLSFRIERIFKIKFKPAIPLLEKAFSFSLKHKQIDIQVSDLVLVVEQAMRDQHVTCEADVYELLRPEIAICLGVDESEVTPTAWMRHDLGME